MKKSLHKMNRIGIALMTVAVLGLTPTAALADETDADLHAGAGSFFASTADDKEDTSAGLVAGVYAAMTKNADSDLLAEITTDEAADALADEGETEITDGLSTIETDIEEEEETEQLTMANVTDAVNVRQEPSEEAPIVGKLYTNCGGVILEQKDGWTKLSSGKLEGWTKDEFLLFGDEAKALYDEVGKLEAKVTTDTLRIRMEADEEAGVLDLVAEGEVLEAVEDQGEWVSVKYNGETGFVSAEYVELTFSVPSGKTTEEIEAEEKAKAEKEAAKAAAKSGKKSDKTTTTDQGAVASASNDVMLLAALIQCEAGRESYEGQLAVGAVVMNRVRSGSYPSSVSGVINQPSQFPPATNGRVANALASGPSASCIQAAQAAISGQSNVGGAVHFGRSGNGIQIGNHNFW